MIGAASRLRSISILGALGLTTACAPAPAALPAEVPPPPSVVPALPARISAGAIPGDASAYGEITGVPEIVSQARKIAGPDLVAEARAAVARELRIDPGVAERLLDSVSSLHFGGKLAGGSFKAAISLVLTDAEPVGEVIASGRLREAGALGPHGRRFVPDQSKEWVVWFEAVKLLVIGEEPMVQDIAAVVEGRTPGRSVAASGAPGPRGTALMTTALLDDLVKNKVSFAAPLTTSHSGWPGGIRGALRTAIAARDLDRDLPLPAPRTLALAGRLPRETLAYLALSTGIPGGRRGAAQLFTQLAAFGGEELNSELSDPKSPLGIALEGVTFLDLVGSLGGEAVLGAMVRGEFKTKKDLEHAVAVVFLQEIAEAKPAEQVVKALRRKLTSDPKKKHKLRPEPGGFSGETGADPPWFVRVKLDKSKLFVAAGPRDLCDRAVAAVERGQATLGADEAHARALNALPAHAALRFWIDFTRWRALFALDKSSPPEVLEFFSRAGKGDNRLTSAISFSAVPEADRVRIELDEVNGIGPFVGLGLYAVRRYLRGARAAEAKTTLNALARAAVVAYEREQPGPKNTVIHRLCGDALPVPSDVPRGVTYMPSSILGLDYDAGDATTGWRCLDFAVSEPQFYRYTYLAGGPYQGPPRGGPDPGPNGFEVAAEGDLDGDGQTSLLTRTGTIDPQTGVLTLSPEIWSDRENE